MEDSRNTKKTLIAALARPQSLGERHSRAFDDLRHTLKDLIERIKEPQTDLVQDRNLLKNLILECAPRAALLHDVMIRLGEAERRLADGRIDIAVPILHDIQDDLDALEDAPRHFVYELCRDHRGPLPLKAPAFALHSWGIIDHKTPISPRLSFELGELRMAVAALRANAHRGIKSSNHYCLTYREWPSFTEIMWLEQIPIRKDSKGNEGESFWKDFVDAPDRGAAVEAMIKAAKTSLESKALYRGLPQVLLFGVENRAKHVALLHKSEWHELWETVPTDETIVLNAVNTWKSWIDEKTKSSGRCWTPNYGWRFIFTNTVDQQNQSHGKKKSLPPLPSPPPLDENQTGRLVFLCDDHKNASWLDPMKSKLSSALENASVRVLSGFEGAQDSQALIAQWVKQIVTESADRKCVVVTDSEFSVSGVIPNGGEQLLLALAATNVLERGLVYSDAPVFNEANWFNYTKSGETICKPYGKSDRPYQDAGQIALFIETGQLDAFQEVIEMIERLAAILIPLLETVKHPPWVLAKEHFNKNEEWRADLDPWRILTESYGHEVLTPFASDTFHHFTDSRRFGLGFQDLFEQRLQYLGVHEDGKDKWRTDAESLRGCLCPVESVVNIVEANDFPRSWEGELPIGALRVLMDLSFNQGGFDSLENEEKWISNRASGIQNKDVALKYGYYLRRYRRECLLPLTCADFPNIRKAVAMQMNGLQDFLSHWRDSPK